jgi:hypothetical protein
MMVLYPALSLSGDLSKNIILITSNLMLEGFTGIPKSFSQGI